MTRPVRWTLVVLLLWGGYWALLPWLDCVRSLPSNPFGMVGICTFGIAVFSSPGQWGNVVVAAIYIVAAAWVAFWRRSGIPT